MKVDGLVFNCYIFFTVPKTIEIIQKYHCPKVSKLKPATSSFECRKNFSLESGSEPFNFSTGDTYVILFNYITSLYNFR